MVEFSYQHVGERLKARTRAFASAVIELCASLRGEDLSQVIRPQLHRASTGVACNYRAVCRSRSDREFASRLAVVIEEADEAEFWLDMLATHVFATASAATPLQDEAAQLRAIFARSRFTVLERLQRNRKNRPDQQDEV